MENDSYWFSADFQGRVIAKTQINSDGSIDRFEYTIPDKIHEGHGHKHYKTFRDFENDYPEWEREADDAKSIRRHWAGNG
jgi:hypothetical protein